MGLPIIEQMAIRRHHRRCCPMEVRESKNQEGGERMSEGIVFSTNHDEDLEWVLYEDSESALKEMRRLKRNKGVRYTMLMRLTPHLSKWVNLTFKKTYEIMEKMEFTRFRNCEITPAWYIKINRMEHSNNRIFSVAVWPVERADYSLTKDNNWGEDE